MNFKQIPLKKKKNNPLCVATERIIKYKNRSKISLRLLLPDENIQAFEKLTALHCVYFCLMKIFRL